MPDKTIAAVMAAPNKPLQIQELKLKKPFLGEVLVQIRSTGICGSDLSVLSGRREHPMPVVLGHEASARIVAVGGKVRTVKPRDEVILLWQPSCRQCPACRAGHLARCGTFKERTTRDRARFLDAKGRPVFAYSFGGTHSQYTVLDEAGVLKVSSRLDPDVASVIGCASVTGMGSVWNNAGLKPFGRAASTSVAVYGAGGVGLNIARAAKLAGVGRIIVIDKFSAKRHLAHQFGATDFLLVTPRTEEKIRRLTEGGVDFLFEATGQPAIQTQSLGALRTGGRAILVGLSGTDPIEVFQVHGRTLVGRGITIGSSLYGDADPAQFIPKLIRLEQQGRLHLRDLVSATYPLERINDAIAAVQNGQIARAVIRFSE